MFALDHKGEIQKQITNPNSPVDDAVYFYQNVSDSKWTIYFLIYLYISMYLFGPAQGL